MSILHFALFLQSLAFVLSVKPLLRRTEGESPIQPVTWFCVSRMEASARWKNIQSKGYPKSLLVKQSRCTWRIQAGKGKRVHIAFKGLQLEADDPAHCSANYVEIVDEKLGKTQGRYCGKYAPGDIVSQGRRVRIDFQAQPGESDVKGFMISFKSTKKKPGFYAKREFATQAPPRTVRPQTMFMNTPYRISEEERVAGIIRTVDIIGIVIGLFVALVIAFLIWRRVRRRKRKKLKLKEKEKESSEKTSKFTDLDPSLPHNEVDPFERVGQACGQRPPEAQQGNKDLRHQQKTGASENHNKQLSLPVASTNKQPARAAAHSRSFHNTVGSRPTGNNNATNARTDQRSYARQHAQPVTHRGQGPEGPKIRKPSMREPQFAPPGRTTSRLPTRSVSQFPPPKNHRGQTIHLPPRPDKSNNNVVKKSFSQKQPHFGSNTTGEIMTISKRPSGGPANTLRPNQNPRFSRLQSYNPGRATKVAQPPKEKFTSFVQNPGEKWKLSTAPASGRMANGSNFGNASRN